MKEKKTRYISPKKGAKVKVCVHDQYVEENLPLKYVVYPSLYGIFIGFSNTLNDKFFFCSCCKNAIENFIQIAKMKEDINEFFNIKIRFPFLSSNSINDPYFKNLKFKDKICHSCNLATPTLRYCHEMYGGNFKQFFGWYINQEYYKMGISQNFDFIEEKCPEEIISIILELKKIGKLITLERKKIYSTPRFNTLQEQLNFLKNRSIDDTDLKKYEKEISPFVKKLNAKIENIARQNFGFSKIGSSWVNESILHKIVSRIFINHTVERNIRPTWFEKLEIDIFVPEKNLGFEYQGKQHFFPVKAWGGEKALIKVQERDKYKVELAKKLGLKLIVIDYTEPLTENYIKEILIQEGIKI